MATQTSGLGFVGQSVKRIEDERLLFGKGSYVADIEPEGVLHASFVRSPFPHARIVNVDTAEAQRLPGVHAVITGAEIEDATNPFPPFGMFPTLYTPLYWALSSERVRMIGDPVAIVVADSRHIAEDAAELVEVEYEQLAPVANIEQALAPSSTPLWEKADGNLLFDHTNTYGEVEDVFIQADRVVTETFSCPRQSNQPMETRGTVVEIDPRSGAMTVHSSTQTSHLLRWLMAGLVTKTSSRKALGEFVRNKDRRKAFLGAAKSFLGENKEALKQQDNTGMKSQLKFDRSFLGHARSIALGLMANDDLPVVKAQDIGGGFGAKGGVHREDIAVGYAAKKLGRSVKWIEDRVENLTDGGHAREEQITCSIAFDNDGTMRGMKVDLIMDQGAYPAFPVGAAFTTQIMKVMFPGSYRFEALEVRNRIVSTNKGKYVAYRGPWANETWVRERMVDVVARDLGLAPAQVRLQNMIGEEDMPTAMITGPTIDETMSVKKTLERALELVDLDAFAAEQKAAARRGRHLGLGIACYHEAAPGPPNYFDSVSPGTDVIADEFARTAVEADGSVVVYTSQMPHGQSHETTYAQVAADELGVDFRDVKLVWGNTDRTPFSFLGTGGSRGGPLGGGSIRGAAREVRSQVAEQAAKMLEASVDDIVITNGNIHVAGVPARGVSLGEVAAATSPSAEALPGEAFTATFKYRGKGDGGWSCATHFCIVEVDLSTGKVAIPRYGVVEDCGPIINPAIVDGQVRGGVAQGIGAVLYEKSVFDDQANLQATTYMDYLIPTAMEIPDIECHHIETLSPGENDFRGVGEGGMIGAPAALTNAIADALAKFDAKITEQYLPPSRILELAGVIEPDE